MMADLLKHIESPRNRGQFERPDAVGVAGTPVRGPYLVVYLKFNDGHIADARYQSEGCGPTIASGSVLTELIIGQSIEFCRSLTAERIRQELGELPPHKQHCPKMAITALNQALDDWCAKLGTDEITAPSDR